MSPGVSSRFATLRRHLTAALPPTALTAALGPLTPAQRRLYDRDGFVVVPGVFDRADLEPLHERYVRICRDPAAFCGKTVGNVVRDINVADGSIASLPWPEHGYIKLNFFCGLEGKDPVLWNYVSHPKLMPYIRQFVGSSVLTANHMYVFNGVAAEVESRS